MPSRIHSISGSFTFPFLSLSFITSMAPSYSDCGREFNKWVMNVSSVENSSSLFFQISCSQRILNSSRLSRYLLLRLLVYMNLSQLMRTFTNYLICHLILTFHFLILRMSEYGKPTIKHISTYTLVSSSTTTYVTDLFLGSNPHSKIPF